LSKIVVLVLLFVFDREMTGVGQATVPAKKQIWVGTVSDPTLEKHVTI
jgi:hypothetical protein